MTILYHFRTQGTGAEGVHISGVARAFEKLGSTVVFSSPTGIDPRATAGANPFQTRERTLLGKLAAQAPRLVFELMELAYNAVALLRNRRYARDHQVGMIYERHAFFLFSTALLAKSLGIPLAVEVNELSGDERVRAKPVLSWLAEQCDRLVFRHAAAIITVSPHLGRRVVELGASADRVLVLPNAVDEESLAQPTEGHSVRAKWGLDGMLVVGFIGWFVPWHKLDRLIQAFASATQHFDARLLLVGDGPLRGELEALAQQAGVASKVIFTGAAPHAEAPNYLAAMDISVVPHSNDYRSPIKLFESMARGATVLAPRTEPIETVIRDWENGVLFSPDDSEELAEKLKELLADSGKRKDLAERARRDVEEKHTWRKNAEAVLECVTKNRPPTTPLS